MPQPRPTYNTQDPHEQLLERIAQRYQQLEIQLEQLEAKLRTSDIPPAPEPPVQSERPRQPR